MKGRFLLSTALLTALLSASCSSDLPVAQDLKENGNSVTFTLRTPVGETVSYTRVLHDEPEYAVNSLTLYEYEVVTDEESGEKSSSLCRVMSYPDGLGRDVLSPVPNGDGSYTFSIIVPAANEGKTYTYRFVANNATAGQTPGTTADDFCNSTYAAVSLRETADADDPGTLLPPTADQLAAEGNGIAMTGTALFNNSEEITMGEDVKCEVSLKRIVSRVDIRFRTPNLKLTKVELQGAPVRSWLFPRTDESGNPLFADTEFRTLNLNSSVSLPDYYLRDNESETEVSLRKAFYLYERANTAADCAKIHIEYTVSANGTEYTGELDIPFRRTGGDMEYIDTERNHLYTIVLGHDDDPVSGKVSASLIVDEWNLVEIDEPLTDADPVKNEENGNGENGNGENENE